MQKEHLFKLTTEWTGNQGSGTSNYRAYSRNYSLSVEHKVDIEGSSVPEFRGDKSKHNPEDLLLGSLSSCHLLWYLHLCAEAGVVVLAYTDNATGVMVERPDGGGHFTEVTLHPVVQVADASMTEMADLLHKKANSLCFIANSVNFPVHHKPCIFFQSA
jgi:organic hydroperoxide reductase OsmC/OhrA